MASRSGPALPTLVVTGGPLDGTEFPIDTTSQEVVIGSGADCLIRIQLGNVEPRHARLRLGPTGLAIADAGSGSGTFVNGEKVEQEHPLQSGDRVCLGPPGSKGSAKMLVLLPGAALAAAPARAAGPALAAHDAGPVILEDEHPPISIPAHAPEPPRPKPPAPPPPAPPAPIPVAAPRPQPPAPPAPPPAAPPPPPLTARAARPEPEYHTELPSIPVERPTEPEPAPRTAARAKERATSRPGRRGGGLRVPVVPLLGGLAALALVGGGAWFLLRAGAPTLSSVTPTRAATGQPVTLVGADFAAQSAENVVRFGDQAGAVTAATATQITAVVPAELAAGGPADVPVTVETKGGRSGAVTLKVYRAAKITALEPEVARPGETILVRGEGLAGPTAVSIGGAKAQIVEAKAEEIRVVVPPLRLHEGASAPVVVELAGETTQPANLLIGRLPLLIEVAPRRGLAGDRVVLKGRGFDPNRFANTVTFAGRPALVLAASASELTVVAPAAPSGEQAELPVVVTAGGRASTSSAGFTVTRLSTSGYVPRFHAAPVTEYPTEDLAFVACELAPVLLLGGKGELATTGERAERVVTALNALVATGATKPVAFEYREAPLPGVGVSGEVNVLLVATAEDAAAYSRRWGAGGRAARSVSPHAVATHWAAILQDYFGLFLYRQRPLKVLSVSPHGAVLSEIYAEATRRAPEGQGVPVSAVLPTTSNMAAALRQMALVVSGDSARASVAVVGRWEGTIEDPDTGSRPFQVRLRAAGSRLAGSVTTWRGPLELTSPLREVSFERGTVRFVADLQGAPHQFTGTLQSDTVTGTVERRGSGRAAVPFSLKFVE